MSENDVILKVNGLKTYFYQASGVSKAVDGVSFSLRQGTTMGIVGESGSGKSVTSASVMRLMPAKTGRIVDGSIIFDGVDIRNLSEAQMEAPVLMMGPPPVKNPDHLERLNKLNETYAGLCLDLGVAYLDLLKGLPAVYVADLDDGLHPGKTGNMLIAEQLLNAPIVQGWIRS